MTTQPPSRQTFCPAGSPRLGEPGDRVSEADDTEIVVNTNVGHSAAGRFLASFSF
jgi:hypothetical protein